MPVRNLSAFAWDHQLVQSQPLMQLRSHQVCIDAGWWIRTYWVKEWAVQAMGGVPFGLRDALMSDVYNFAEAGITPMFVFGGLQPLRRDTPFQGPDLYAARAEAWRLSSQNKAAEARDKFASVNTLLTPDTVNATIKLMKENRVSFMRAPLHPWAQIAHLGRTNGYSMCGGLELFLLGADAVIIDVNFTSQTFHYVVLAQLLASIMLKHEQFVDASLLAGFDGAQIGTFPPIREGFKFIKACQLVKRHGSGEGVLEAYADDPEVMSKDHASQFHLAKLRLMHHLVCTMTPGNVTVDPLNASVAPPNLHEILAPRLPITLYFLLVQGVVSPQLINGLVSGVVLEFPPIADTKECRALLGKLHGVREKAYGAISKSLHPSFSRSVKFLSWIDRGEHPKVLKLPPAPKTPSKEAGKAGAESVRGGKGGGAAGCVDRYQLSQKEIFSHVKFLAKNYHAVGPCLVADLWLRKTQHGLPSLPHIKDLDTRRQPGNTRAEQLEHAISVILLEAFRDLGYIDPRTLMPSPLLEAMAGYAGPHSGQFLLALEMARLGLLHGKPFRAVHGVESVPAGPGQLVCRVLSLVPVRTKSAAWSTYVSFDMAAFTSQAHAVRISLRNLLEAHLASMYLDGELDLPHSEQYAQASLRLPLVEDASCALGIVVEQIFAKIVQPSGFEVQISFPSLENPMASLHDGFIFWREVVTMVSKMANAGVIKQEVFAEFAAADTYLHSQGVLSALLGVPSTPVANSRSSLG